MTALPLNSLGLAALLGAALLALDALLRRLGAYSAVDANWPAAWRARRVHRSDDAVPYRAGSAVEWEPAMPEGIPRAASLFLTPAVVLAFVWSLAILLALSDFPGVFAGTRGALHALASLALCVARAVGGWCVIGGVLERRARAVASYSAFTIGLDAALWAFALPCSDVRADDVRMAVVGLTIHLPLGLGFAWSQWRRRGTVGASQGEAPVFH